jgi:maleate isomerase
MAMWQPDGGARTRIGVLTPHADVWPEAEFCAMAPDGISIHAARVHFGAYRPGGAMDPTIAADPVRKFADPPLVDDAAELLASAPLHAIAYGFTSSSYLRGAADDARLKERLEKRTRGIPVVITCAAAVTALAALGVTRLALISSPWFSAEMDQQGVRYFQSQGFEVVHSGPAGLPSDQQAIEPGELYEWVRTQTPDSAEAVFIGGNGLRAVGVIKAGGKSRSPDPDREPGGFLASPCAVGIAPGGRRLWPDIRSSGCCRQKRVMLGERDAVRRVNLNSSRSATARKNRVRE